MRRTPTVLRRARQGCRALTLLLAVSVTAVAQTAPARSAKKEPEPIPPGSYAARDRLLAYLECNGLDAHAEAWQKTAASKLLNQTKLGAWLEDLGTQFYDKMLGPDPNRRVSGADIVRLAKHVAHSGFVYARYAHPRDPHRPVTVLVLRGANGKEIRGVAARSVLALGGPDARPELAKRPTGRAVVLMNGARPGTRWGWWVEKNDIVIVPSADDADTVGEVLDGKYPNAIDHPIRTELAAADGTIEPVVLGFIDGAAWPEGQPRPAFLEKLQVRGVDRADYRWGLSGDALASTVRIKARAPRQGLLAVFDGPTFDTKNLPLMTDGTNGFLALSIQPAKVFETLTATLRSVSPAAAARIDESVEAFRKRTRLDLPKDVLAPLGPKMAFYASSKPGPPLALSRGAARKAAEGEEPGEPAETPDGQIEKLLSTTETPRGVFMAETRDPKAFERALDSIMIVVNQQMRERAKRAAPPKEEGDEGEEKSKRRKEPASAEFRMMPGLQKSYLLNVPSEVAKLPAGFRPTIRLGAKAVVLATAPDLARQALDLTKATAWSPADEYATALDRVSQDLVFLKLDEPATTMRYSMTFLPAVLQATVTALGKTDVKAGKGKPSSAEPAAEPTAEAAEPAPEGAEGQDPARAETARVIRVDPSRVPTADSLKPFLFPGTLSIAVTSDEVRLERRDAFPKLASPMSMVGLALVLPAIREANKAHAAAVQQNAARAKAAAAPAPKGAGDGR